MVLGINVPGERILAIGIAIEDVMLIVFSGLILAIGQVMAEVSGSPTTTVRSSEAAHGDRRQP